jgi:hypothetical protein
LNARFSEARNRDSQQLLWPVLFLLLALGASSGAAAQAIGAPLRGVEIVSEAIRPDAKREGDSSIPKMVSWI